MGMDAVMRAPAFAELRIHSQDIDEDEALRVFDSYFLAMILKGGSQPLGGTDHLLDGGQAGRMYRDFFHQELARIVAERGNIGLAESLRGELDKPNESAESGGSAEHEEDPK